MNIFDDPKGPLQKIAYLYYYSKIKFRNNVYIPVKDFFFPWNKIKVMNMTRGWHDRDYVLMHAMFTIFVDFIEGEQPFVDWDIRHKHDRFTDVEVMAKFIEENYGPNANVDDYEEGCCGSKEWNAKVYPVKKELLWIYKWYIDKEWEFDYVKHNYSWEAEQEHDKKCDDMLHRLVAFRHYFWT